MKAPFDPKESGRRGGLARAAALSPERRQLIAAQANYARWYGSRGETEHRVDNHLRLLAKLVSKAMAEGDDNRAIRAVSAMASYERMKLIFELQRKQGKDADPAPLDDSMARKLDEARRRRALALEDGETIVLEEKKE